MVSRACDLSRSGSRRRLKSNRGRPGGAAAHGRKPEAQREAQRERWWVGIYGRSVPVTRPFLGRALRAVPQAR